MSTKFSVRPAPRKRPWICKRSPPCLIPPTWPPSLVASWSLQKLQPPPQGPGFGGSLLLRWRPMLAHYSGSWLSPPNGFTLVFNFNPITGHTTNNAQWDLGGFLDWGTYAYSTFSLPANFLFNSQYVSATTYQWRGALTITG